MDPCGTPDMRAFKFDPPYQRRKLLVTSQMIGGYLNEILQECSLKIWWKLNLKIKKWEFTDCFVINEK